MATLGSLVYKLQMDHSDFTKGAVSTRRELKRSRELFGTTRTAAERFGHAQKELARLLKKGAITKDTYRRALKKVKDEMKGATANTRGFNLGFMKLSPHMLAAAAATAGFVAALRGLRFAIRTINEAMERIDKLAKVSAKLGMTTRQLVGLRLAASEFSGVASSTLDMALQRFSRRIAEAANGSGEARSAFIELGLSAVELRDAGPAEAFRMVADAMQNVKNEGDRLRLSFKLFDSEGAALSSTLAAGRKALLEMETAADELGATFNRFEAAQIEEAKDALGRLGLALQGIANDFAITLAPEIEKFAELLVHAFTKGQAMHGVFQKMFLMAKSHMMTINFAIGGFNDTMAEITGAPAMKPKAITTIMDAAILAEERVNNLATTLESMRPAREIAAPLERKQLSEQETRAASEAFLILSKSVAAAQEKGNELGDVFKTLNLDPAAVSAMSAADALRTVRGAIGELKEGRGEVAAAIFGDVHGGAMAALFEAAEFMGAGGDWSGVAERLGTDARTISNAFAEMSSGERVKFLIEHLQSIDDKTERAHAAFELLGPAAANLGGLIHTTASEFDELNASMGNVDTAATAEQIGISVKALDGLRRAAADLHNVGASDMDAALKEMVRVLAAAEVAGSKEFNFLRAIGLDGDAIGQILEMSVDAQFLAIGEAVRDMQGSWAQAATGIENIFGVVADGTPLAENFFRVVNAGTGALQAAAEATNDVDRAMLGWMDTAFGVLASEGAAGGQFAPFLGALDEAADNFQRNITRIGNVARGLLPDIGGMGEQFLDNLRGGIERAKQDADEIDKLSKNFASEKIKADIAAKNEAGGGLMGRHELQVELMKEMRGLSEDEVAQLRKQAQELDAITEKKKKIKELDAGPMAGRGVTAELSGMLINQMNRDARERAVLPARFRVDPRRLRNAAAPRAHDVQRGVIEEPPHPFAANAGQANTILAGIKTELEAINSKDLLTVQMAEGVV